MTTPATKCSYCQKSGLSLLLLRPSPIATHGDLQAPGSSNAVADQSLVERFVPAGLTESRPVLRLLRAGFVHLYVPSTDQWRIWRVTEKAELLEQNHPMFGAPAVSVQCKSQGHNETGFKLLQIPQAHELVGKSVWLAFSANRWSDKLKQQNKANPLAMVEVKLGSVSAPAFKPDAPNLKRQVLEWNVTSWSIPKLPTTFAPAFAFSGLIKDVPVEHMARTLAEVAARHPITAGHELAVVLPDPVGYATELNALRLLRNEFSKLEQKKPENAHPLISLQMMDGLRQSVVDEQEARSWDAVTPIMTHGAFEDIMRVKPNPRGWPKDVRWEPLTERDEKIRHGQFAGRVIFPDHDQRAQAWAKAATARNWQRYRKYLNEDGIKSWKQAFDKKMQAMHGEPIRRYEVDWLKARQFKGFTDYFALHYDETDPNRPGTAQDHSPGASYAHEVFLSMTPQPLMQGPVLDEYLAELGKPATATTAQMQRALAGNQSTVLAALQEYAQNTRPDKLHDLGSGLLIRTEANTVLGRHHIKYGWLLHPLYGAATLGITQALSAAVSGSSAVAGALGLAGGIGPKGRLLIDKLEALLMAAHAMKLVGHSAIKSTLREVPMHVSVRMPAAEAQQAFRQRNAAGSTSPPQRSVNQMAVQGKGWITVTVMTTNLELAQVGYDPKVAMAAGTGSVTLGSTAALTRSAQTIALSGDALAALMKRQATAWEAASAAMRDLARAVKGGTVSLDGQIGLVALLLNGWSVVGTMSNQTTDWTDWNTRWGVLDSSAGTLGGLAQVMQAAFSGVIAARAGEEAAKQSLWVMGAGVVASGAGAFGGLATAAGQFVKASRADDVSTATLYGISGLSFFNQGAIGGIQFAGALSEFMIERGSQRAIWFVGARVAAGTGARLVAVTGIGLTGWGLIFLAAGLVFEVGVVLLTPDALQKHVQKTYFGQGGEADKKYKSLEEEEAGVKALSDPPPKQAGLTPEEEANLTALMTAGP